MRTEQQVRAALAKRFDVARLNTGPSGKVYGVVQSEGFRGVAEAERQERVWDPALLRRPKLPAPCPTRARYVT